ncbi:MAG: hypothetical protein OXC25_14655 [Thiotrichales bacterium]|nr:hypothetical protein [Thiotrichales bacterium]MCY4351080.1 hypothetical protein [Thiotrichales bacterium]
MKTTLNLNDQILRQAKGQAAQGGITLTKFVEDALREKLMAEHHQRPAFKLRMRTVRGYAPPNVDISDRDALYDVMDRG